MAQTFRNGHTVHPVEVAHRGHCVPESVGVDVRKVMPRTEFIQPSLYAVWVHGLAVILRKYIALVLVVFAQPKPFFILPCPILTQELHGFERESHKADGGLCLWRFLILANIRLIQNAVADVDSVVVEFHVVPFQLPGLPRALRRLSAAYERMFSI